MRATPATRKRIATTRNEACRLEAYSISSQTPQKNESRIDMKINTIWNAFSDISSNLDNARMGHGPQRQEQQSGEKESSASEHAVNHLFLGNQVHKETRH